MPKFVSLLMIISESDRETMTTPGKIYEITDPAIEESRHTRWINLARKVAERSTFPEQKMGAVVIKSGRVIATGVNKAKSGIAKSRFYNKNQAHHAELDTLDGIPDDVLSGAIIYVAGLSPNRCSLVWSSKPCPSCQALLRSRGIKAAIYHDAQGRPYIWKVS